MPIAAAIRVTTRRLSDHPGEQGPRAGPEGLEHAVQAARSIGDQREEERHDDDRDHHRDADDLVETVAAACTTPGSALMAGVDGSPLSCHRRCGPSPGRSRARPGSVRRWCARRAPGPRRRRPARQAGWRSAQRASSAAIPTATPGPGISVSSTNPTTGHASTGPAELEDRPDLDPLGLSDAVGIRPRRRPAAWRAAPRRELVAEEHDRDEIARAVAGHARAELGAAEPADAGRPRAPRRPGRPCAGVIRLRTSDCAGGAENTTRSARWARSAPVLLATSPSSRPPRNISSIAMRVRMIVATMNRPGRRRSSRSASLIGRPHRTRRRDRSARRGHAANSAQHTEDKHPTAQAPTAIVSNDNGSIRCA